MPPGVWVVPAVPLLLGLVFSTIGWFTPWQRRGWVRTQGRVVPSRHAVAVFTSGTAVEYQDQNGRWHSNEVTGAPYRHSPADGAVVGVVYDPARPDRVGLDGAIHSGLVFRVIGGMLVGLALIGWLGVAYAWVILG